MENKVIKDLYIQGCGWVRLFFRKQGTEYRAERYDSSDIQHADKFIIQFGGFPAYDSGYDVHEFDTIEQALTYWGELVEILEP